MFKRRFIFVMTIVCISLFGCRAPSVASTDTNKVSGVAAEADISDDKIKYELANRADTADTFRYKSKIAIRYNSSSGKKNSLDISDEYTVSKSNNFIHQVQDREYGSENKKSSTETYVYNNEVYFLNSNSGDSWSKLGKVDVELNSEYPLSHNMAAAMEISSTDVANNGKDISVSGEIDAKYIAGLLKSTTDLSGDLSGKMLPIDMKIRIQEDGNDTKYIPVDFNINLKDIFENTQYIKGTSSESIECESFVISVLMLNSDEEAIEVTVPDEVLKAK